MHVAIRETAFTPSVKISPEDNRIIITGPSRLEDPSPFYEKLVIVLDETIINCKSRFSIDFKLNYLNSSSSKWLFHILKNVQNRFGKTRTMSINWYYDTDDENMLEAGEVFQNLLNVPFRIIEA
ncbi:MAG TPA: DUF1987 domain-containing protein [Bacteroidales bacterium]|jgi:hypothetical protein|nr:DUF1987 domain-containing protein [Bacteroidales bacterium]